MTILTGSSVEEFKDSKTVLGRNSGINNKYTPSLAPPPPWDSWRRRILACVVVGDDWGQSGSWKMSRGKLCRASWEFAGRSSHLLLPHCGRHDPEPGGLRSAHKHNASHKCVGSPQPFSFSSIDTTEQKRQQGCTYTSILGLNWCKRG